MINSNFLAFTCLIPASAFLLPYIFGWMKSSLAFRFFVVSSSGAPSSEDAFRLLLPFITDIMLSHGL
jgi:hypothetical protein